MDGCSVISLRVTLLYVSVLTALIIAPLSTVAKNRTHSPCGPCSDVTVLNGALVAACIGLPVSSNAYTSTMLFMLADSTFLKVWRRSSSTAKSNAPLIVSGMSVYSETQSTCRSIVAANFWGWSCVITNDGAVLSMSGFGDGTTAGPLPAVVPPHFPMLMTSPKLHFLVCWCQTCKVRLQCLHHGMSRLVGLALA